MYEGTIDSRDENWITYSEHLRYGLLYELLCLFLSLQGTQDNVWT